MSEDKRDKVVHLSLVRKQQEQIQKQIADWSLQGMLEECQKDLDEGARSANKAFLILLDDSAGKYSTCFYQLGNLTFAEMVTLMEVVKSNVIEGLYEYSDE